MPGYFDAADFDPAYFDIATGTVNDAQFDLWLRQPRQRCILYEQTFGYESGTPLVAREGTLYLSNMPYKSGPGQSPPSQMYRDRIGGAPSYRRQIDRSTLGGRVINTVSDVVLDNTDNGIRVMRRPVLDGYTGQFLLGDPSWPRGDFRLIFKTTARRVDRTSTDEYTVRLSDVNLLLNKALVGAPLGGSSVNADKPAPIVIGRVGQVELLAIDTANLIYRWGDSRYIYQPTGYDSTSIAQVAVYDNGFPLTTFDISGGTAAADLSTDRINMTGSSKPLAVNDIVVFWDPFEPDITAGMAPPLVMYQQYWVVAVFGTYPTYSVQLSLTRGGTPINLTGNGNMGAKFISRMGFYNFFDGRIQLSASQVGTISGYVNNSKFASQNAWLSDLFSWLAISAGGLDAVTQYNGPHASAPYGNADPDHLDDNESGFVVTERTNVLDLLDRVAESACAAYTSTYDGKFTWLRVRTNPLDITPDPSSFNTSKRTFTDDDVIGDNVTTTHMDPRYHTVAAWGRLNYPPLSQIAAGVRPDTAKALRATGQIYATDGETGSTYATAPSRLHRRMTTSPEYQTLYYGSSPLATRFCRFTRTRLWPWLEFRDFVAPLHTWFNRGTRLELGDKVSCQMTRLASDGQLNNDWQIIDIDIRLSDFTVAYGLVRRLVPVTDQGELFA